MRSRAANNSKNRRTGLFGYSSYSERSGGRGESVAVEAPDRAGSQFSVRLGFADFSAGVRVGLERTRVRCGSFRADPTQVIRDRDCSLVTEFSKGVSHVLIEVIK
jgi:hypothetical protein